jgi:hypothetical protein
MLEAGRPAVSEVIAADTPASVWAMFGVGVGAADDVGATDCGDADADVVGVTDTEPAATGPES